MMKKIISVLLVLTLFTAVFAADVTFNGIKAVDNRSFAMGGQHVADSSDYFTLLRNPAGLAFTGKKTLVGVTNIGVGGPLEEVLDMYSTGKFDNMTQDTMIDAASELMKQNKLNLGLTLGGPIAFGGISKNGFGWGVFNQVIANAQAPSTILKATTEADFDILLGYGHNFALGPFGNLAVGLSTDLYSQAYISQKMNVMTQFSQLMNNPNDILKGAKVKTALGANVNAGISYNVLNFVKAGLVWNNFFSAVVNNNIENFNIDNPDYSQFGNFDFNKVEVAAGQGTIDLGVGVEIPTFWGLGIISDWTVYADCNDVIGFIKNDPLERNPMLNLGCGSELKLLKFISLRAGISDSYLNAGVGFNLLGLHIDGAIYGKELGKEPGTSPQLNAALSIGIFF